jgi:tyrosine-protein kinase Etk/Wzc
MKINDELNLRDFFAVFRRRRREFLGAWIGVVGVTWIYTALVTPLYRAQVLFKVHAGEDSNRPADLSALGILGAQQQTFNVEQLLAPQILEEGVRRLEKLPPGGGGRSFDLKVQDLARRSTVDYTDRDNQLVTFSVTSPNPARAANEANVLSEVMVEQVTKDSTLKAHVTKKFIQQQLQETESRLHASEEKVRGFQQRFGPQSSQSLIAGKLLDLQDKRDQLARKYTSSFPELKDLTKEIQVLEGRLQKIPQQEIDIARVTREVRLNEELFTMLTKRLEEANIVESARVEPITIMEQAMEPGRPEYPNKRFNLIAGFVFGFFLGLIIVLVREQLDTSMVTTEEIEDYLQLPVLATVPHIERRDANAEPMGPRIRRRDRLGEIQSRLICNFAPKSSVVEVYHILRNNLTRNVKSGENQVYLFTSAVVAEGKSLTAANFAVAAAQAGIPTLLAEVDLRKPMVDKLFGIPPEPGLTDYFFRSPRWESYVMDWDKMKSVSPKLASAINTSGMANLHVLPSGPSPSNPVSLLSSDRFLQLLADMRRRYPLVILDGAPAMLFADSAILGRHVDGVVLVYRFGRTAREVLSRAHNQLSSSNAKILGVVVNDIAQGTQQNDYYQMYGYYAEEEHEKKVV